MNTNYSAKTFVREPRSPFSASQFLENSGIYSAEKKTHWSGQKNVPWQVTAARIDAAAKEKIADIREEFRARAEKPRSIFLVAKRIKGNKIKAIGFLEEFNNFAEVKAFAKTIGREKVKMGAVVAKV